MLTWGKKFFFDETAFVGLVRGVTLGAGGAVLAYPDTFHMLPKWAGLLCLGAAGFIRAGEKNPPKDTE